MTPALEVRLRIRGRTVGAGVREERRVLSDAGLLLGRSADCDVRLDDGRLASAQARLRPGPGSCLVEELGDEACTFVNGVPVPPGRPRVLRTGDVLGLGAHDVDVEVVPLGPVAARVRHALGGATRMAGPCLEVLGVTDGLLALPLGRRVAIVSRAGELRTEVDGHPDALAHVHAVWTGVVLEPATGTPRALAGGEVLRLGAWEVRLRDWPADAPPAAPEPASAPPEQPADEPAETRSADTPSEPVPVRADAAAAATMPGTEQPGRISDASGSNAWLLRVAVLSLLGILAAAFVIALALGA